MALWDSGWADFRRRLGIGAPSSAGAFNDPYSQQAVERLNDPEGQSSAFELWLQRLNDVNPGLGLSLRGQFANLQTRYKAGAAADPTLSWTRFLDSYGPQEAHRLRSMLNPFERGDRPQSYLGRYKYLKA